MEGEKRMRYDFETLIPRKNMGSRKWDVMAQHNPDAAEDVIPLSVPIWSLKPAELAEGLKDYIDHSILGYTMPNNAFYESVVRWMKDRHQWEIKPDWLVQAPGVVNALFGIVKLLPNQRRGHYHAAGILSVFHGHHSKRSGIGQQRADL